MDGKNKAGNNTDLALIGAGNLAKMLGIAFSPAKSVTIPASIITFIADNIQRRRNKKHFDRLEKLIKSLDYRLSRLECKPFEPLDTDLLDEIVAKAVSDEDEDKIELYAAMVQYWMEHKTQLAPYEIRLLGNAIKELTVYEIEAFHGFFISGQEYVTKKMPKQLQDGFWGRISFLALLGGYGRTDIKNREGVTPIGRMLVEIYKLSIAIPSK